MGNFFGFEHSPIVYKLIDLLCESHRDVSCDAVWKIFELKSKMIALHKTNIAPENERFKD